MSTTFLDDLLCAFIPILACMLTSSNLISLATTSPFIYRLKKTNTLVKYGPAENLNTRKGKKYVGCKHKPG